MLNRINRLIKGFFGLFIGRLEKNNPDVLFEDIKNQVNKTKKDAEQQIIDIQTNAELIKIEMNQSEKKLSVVRSRIEAAQKQNDKDILVELLMQEEEHQNVYEAHKNTYNTAIIEVNKIREDYKIFESEMNAKLSEIKSLKTQAKMASFKENINSINAKYTSKGNKVGKVNESIERAREIVNQKTARANAIESLGDNTDLKMKKLDVNSARDRAQIKADSLISTSSADFEFNGGFTVREKETKIKQQ